MINLVMPGAWHSVNTIISSKSQWFLFLTRCLYILAMKLGLFLLIYMPVQLLVKMYLVIIPITSQMYFMSILPFQEFPCLPLFFFYLKSIFSLRSIVSEVFLTNPASFPHFLKFIYQYFFFKDLNMYIRSPVRTGLKLKDS